MRHPSLVFAVAILALCGVTRPLLAEGQKLSGEQSAACKRLKLDEAEIVKLIDKPLYKFNEAEVDKYVAFLSATEPNLRKRIVHLARKNIGQPYEIYLLGEMPFEP
jgi:hypothetical protein